VKFVAVVIGDQTCALLIAIGAKFQRRASIIGGILLPPDNEELFEPTVDAFPPGQDERTAINVEKALWVGRMQPLELWRQPVKSRVSHRDTQRGISWVIDGFRRQQLTVFYIQPVIAPDAARNAGFAPCGAEWLTIMHQRAAHQIGVPGRAVRPPRHTVRGRCVEWDDPARPA
jgi:hypothetical protein